MARHAPSHRRELIRRLKAGEHPADLLEEAREIEDPGHAASALVRLSGDPRIPVKKAVPILVEARKLLRQMDRPTRMGEAWGDVLSQLDQWHPGHGNKEKASIADGAMRAIEDMPDGSWTRDAIAALAPHVDAMCRERLLRRALSNSGFEADAKDILKVAPRDEHPALLAIIEAAGGAAAPRLAARLGDQKKALDTAWGLSDAAERHEALRILIWQADDVETVEAIGRTAHGHSAFDRVAVLTMTGARLDRMGHPRGKEHLALAQRLLPTVEEASLAKATRKLATAMERAGMNAPTAPAQVEEALPDIPVDAQPRSTLALVNSYAGGLGAPHVRAVARAAPLCIAFDLDMVLIDFPGSIEDIATMVGADSQVGEGAGYAQTLVDAGRLRALPLVNGLPEAWPGRPVATTPHPDPEKAKDLLALQRPVCLLVGVGRQGIPKRMLHAAQVHYELTGQGISLETATAMGILADRLGRLA